MCRKPASGKSPQQQASVSEGFDSILSLSILSRVSEVIHAQTCLLKLGHLYYLKGNLASQSAVTLGESMCCTLAGISLFTFHGSLQSNYLLLICNLCEMGGWPRASLRGVGTNRLALEHVCVCAQHLVMMNLLGGVVENCGLHPSELLHFHELEEKTKNLVKKFIRE